MVSFFETSMVWPQVYKAEMSCTLLHIKQSASWLLIIIISSRYCPFSNSFFRVFVFFILLYIYSI